MTGAQALVVGWIVLAVLLAGLGHFLRRPR